MAAYPCFPPPNSVCTDAAFAMSASRASSRVFRVGFPRIVRMLLGGLGNPFVIVSTLSVAFLLLYYYFLFSCLLGGCSLGFAVFVAVHVLLFVSASNVLFLRFLSDVC